MHRDSPVAPVTDEESSLVSEISSSDHSVLVTVRGELADHINRRFKALLVPRLGSERIFHLSMQEDRQPNEIRIQRKGDHRIPKVRSSASLGPYRQSRLSNATRSGAKKSWRNRPPRRHDEGVVRGSTSGQGSSATNRQPAGNVSTPDVCEKNP
jgi:hypothetical protein